MLIWLFLAFSEMGRATADVHPYSCSDPFSVLAAGPLVLSAL